jgi:hypothetical protein
MSSGLPPNVSYFMSRLMGVSTSHFKIFPQNSGSQSANKIIRFELPSNTLLSTRSLRMMFNITTTSTSAVAQARIFGDTRSVIDRMAIYMGGVLVQNSFSNYNVLVHAKKALGADRCSDTTLTHPEICRAVSYHDGTVFDAGATAVEARHESYSTLDKQLAIVDWESFLGSCEPGILDTGLFPQITIEITLADNVILPQCVWAANTTLALATTATTGGIAAVGAGTASYTMDNITMQVEVLGMASSVLDEVVAQRVSQVGYLSIPFKNYFSFSSSHSATSRFNVNSASWDRLWVAWRDANGGAVSGAVPVSGYKIAGAFASTGSASYVSSATQDLGKPTYDIGGSLDTNREKYVARAFNFVEPIAAGAISNYQLQINSANYPAYKLTVPEVYALTMNSIDVYDKTRVMSLDQYRDNFFCQCYRFCLPESDYSRLASGLDTRATSAQCALVTENVNNSTPCFIFAECTSELRVANRAIEVIV